ncbi:MAG: hypothetical protein FJ144_16675 [Deltaproteobacteria bacterium]|nr:hypothetical protein [Deltaproteobacteria bacterium]
MSILERDPWRMQYFAHADCPEDLPIPTDDPDSWELYPRHRWVYNKLLVCETQGLEHAPHGVPPRSYPVFSKPIYNLRGMGAGSRVLASAKEYEEHRLPGHMWMPLLEGEHVSTDVAVVRGEPRWWRHVVGEVVGDGMFDYWTVLAAPRAEIEAYCGEWTRRHLGDYTGMLNFETIGGRIIEVHLRFSDQWPDLYGPGWIEALVELHRVGEWRFADGARRDGYSVVLFGAHGPHHRAPPAALVDEIRGRPGISSVQITFHEDKAPGMHTMPPGGFRLAVVNCWSLDAGFAAREVLSRAFHS